MKSGSSAPIHSLVQVERCLRHLLVEPVVAARPASATSASVRRATSTVSTSDKPSIALSTVFLSGIFLPPRRPSLAVITMRQRASMMRSRSDSALKPPNTTECTAPIRAHASIA